MVLEPLPGSVSLAAFGILTSLAIAMQVVVRLPRTPARPGTEELARQQFLVLFASILVGATLGLSFYIAAHSIAPTNDLNVVRLFGPLAAGALISIVAADAAMAASPEFTSQAMQRVWRGRQRGLFRKALRAARGGGEWPTAPERRGEVLVMCITPLLLTIATVATFVRPLSAEVTLKVFGLAVVAALAAYCLSAVLFYFVLTRKWVEFSFVITLTLCIYLVVTLGQIISAYAVAAETLSVGLAARGLFLRLLLLYFPFLIAAFSLTRPPFTSRAGYLRYRVAVVLVNRLRGLNPSRKKPPTRSKRNPFAVAAIWCVPFPPIAIVFGRVALEQLDIASQNGSPTQRGRLLAWVAIGVGMLLVILILGICVWAWGANPPLPVQAGAISNE